MRANINEFLKHTNLASSGLGCFGAKTPLAVIHGPATPGSDDSQSCLLLAVDVLTASQLNVYCGQDWPIIAYGAQPSTFISN